MGLGGKTMKGSESDPHRDDFDIVVPILANYLLT
jgi:hypothetical protein